MRSRKGKFKERICLELKTYKLFPFPNFTLFILEGKKNLTKVVYK